MLKKILISLVLVLGIFSLVSSASAYGDRMVSDGGAPMMKLMQTMRMYSADQWGESFRSFAESRLQSHPAFPVGFVAALVAVFALAKLMMTIATVLFAVLVFKKQSRMLTEDTVMDFWPNVLKGILCLIAAPIVLVCIGFTVIGLPLALIGFLVYALWLVVSNVFSFVVIGAWSYHKLFKTPSVVVDWHTALFGILIVYVVGLIPFIGWLAVTISVMAVMGALIKDWHRKMWLMRD
jgi:hypothetical protein